MLFIGMWYEQALEEFRKEYSEEKMMAHIKNCEECWVDKYLSVHHIDKFNRNNDRNNLIKLCIKCHMAKHEWEPVWRIMNKRYLQTQYV